MLFSFAASSCSFAKFAASTNPEVPMKMERFGREQQEVTITVSQAPDFVKKSAILIQTAFEGSVK